LSSSIPQIDQPAEALIVAELPASLRERNL
jgi:hypothetical protein